VRKPLLGLALVLVLALGASGFLAGAALLIRAYVVEPFVVPTGAMAPTIQSGDRILAWKRPFTPERGDVVVFRSLADPHVNYVKRVAAVAGETVEFRADGVYIDDSRVADGALGRMAYVALTVSPGAPQWAREGEPFQVPPGHVFLVGDNLQNSLDSRLFGPVPVGNIVGKAYRRYWPLDRSGPIE